VNVFGTQQFSATVTGATNKAVNWEVNGVTGGSQATGFISSTGLFVAPGAVPTVSNGSGGTVLTTVTVAAVSQASASASGSTAVTIQASTNQNAQSGAVSEITRGDQAVLDFSITPDTRSIVALISTPGSFATAEALKALKFQERLAAGVA